MAQTTVSDIAKFIRRAKGKKPFVFVTGAGCSKSAGMPLASKLVKMAKEKYPFNLNQLLKDKQNNYMVYMGCIGLSDLRTWFRQLVQGSKIYWAHIALACLMKAGYDFLIADPAIVHSHGQSQGFHQYNDKKRLKRQAPHLGAFMKATFVNSRTLFFGYSGFDPFFNQISKNFKGKQELRWLDKDDKAKPHVNKFLNRHSKLSYYLGGQDADKYLIQLAQALGYFPPDILRNPYGYALAKLKEVIDYPKGVGSANFLPNIREQLGEDDKKQQKAKQVHLHGLYLQENYKEVLFEHEKRGTSATPEDTDTAAWAYVMQAEALLEPAGSVPQSESQYAKAFEKYQEAVRIKPDYVAAWNNWGNALMQHAAHLNEPARSQRYQEAFEKYQEAVRIKPKFHEAWNNWGLALSDSAVHLNEPARSQRYQEAFEKYQEAVRIKPELHQAWDNWGNALKQSAAHLNGPARSQRYQEAFKKYQEAVRIKPDDYWAWSNWGLALSDSAAHLNEPARSQRYQEAFEKYQEAVRIKPEFRDAWYNWGNALTKYAADLDEPARSQRYQKAFEKYQEAVRIKPDDYAAWYNWGTALSDSAAHLNEPARSQRYQEAFKKYQEAVRIKPELHQAWHNWGVALKQYAAHLNEPARSQYLKEAEEKLSRAKSLSLIERVLRIY